MGVFSTAKKIFNNTINIRVDRWIDYQFIRETAVRLKSIAKNAFTIESAEHNEDFDAALNRLNLTETDLIARQREFTHLFIIHLLVALCIFLYSIYLFCINNWGAGIMTMCLSVYPISSAFKFHFWLYQIKHKKLGCSLKDWWNDN